MSFDETVDSVLYFDLKKRIDGDGSLEGISEHLENFKSKETEVGKEKSSLRNRDRRDAAGETIYKPYSAYQTI